MCWACTCLHLRGSASLYLMLWTLFLPHPTPSPRVEAGPEGAWSEWQSLLTSVQNEETEV